MTWQLIYPSVASNSLAGYGSLPRVMSTLPSEVLLSSNVECAQLPFIIQYATSESIWPVTLKVTKVVLFGLRQDATKWSLNRIMNKNKKSDCAQCHHNVMR